MLLKRRTAMKVGVLVGVAVTYFGDPDLGRERRREAAERAGKTLQDIGLTAWADTVRALLHPDEDIAELLDAGSGREAAADRDPHAASERVREVAGT